jgi:Ca2+-binding EF-hand superfamily protein
MSSEKEVADQLPSNFDVSGLSSAFSNPEQAFRLLDKNGDGRVTKEDLKLLLEQFGIKGIPAKVLAKFIFKRLDADGSGAIEPSDLTHANGILSAILKTKNKGA